MDHAAMDGKTMVKFLKSWAHFCKYGTMPEDLDLPMRLDRTVINVPTELESKVLELLPYDKANVIALKLHSIKKNGDDAIQFTLELTQENVKKLRERAKSESTRSDLHLSTFVLTYAYVLTCVVKARRVHADQLVPFTYSADFRDRLDPPVPVSYFGNCVFPINFNGYKAERFLGDDGFINGVEILSDSVKGLSSPGAEKLGELYEEGLKEMKLCLAVAGSNKFGIYGLDFGWGRPVHTVNISISPNYLFTMSERRDETGGVEIGMRLKKSEIDVFISIFQNGLDN